MFVKTNTIPTTVCDEEWYIYIYIYIERKRPRQRQKREDFDEYYERVVSSSSSSIFSIMRQYFLVTLLPSALSMISPRWVMTINALMTAHSLTPTRDKSSTR